MKENNPPQKYRPPAVRQQNEAASQQPQNMMYANPVVNHATLTLPQSSNIVMFDGVMVDVSIAPYSAYEQQPNMIPPHIVNANQCPIYEPQQTGKNNEPETVEAKIAKITKDVRGLLNRIIPATYADLSVEMINKCVWRDEETLPTVVELIFTKAAEEPTFAGLYSDLCHSLHKAEQGMEGENFKRHFQGAIIRKCQRTLENTTLPEYPESVTKLQEQLKEEETKVDRKDENKIAALKKEIEEMSVKEKRRMLGIVKFISHLFRTGLLIFKTIENCIVILIRNAEKGNKETMIEYAVVMMKCVGPHVGQKTDSMTKLDGYVTYLDKFKATVSNRVKFMIVDLMELKEKKWVQQQK